MRYYYTDELQAAWMAREFGIRLLNEKGSELVSEQGNIIQLYSEDGEFPFSKLYVHHHDYEMLEPRVGDIVCWGLADGALVQRVVSNEEYREICIKSDDCRKDSDEDFKYDCDLETYTTVAVDYVDFDGIIQRNGKAFFAPEQEQE